MELQPQDRVVITEPQIHGNSSILLDGQLLSIEGSNGLVAVADEVVPRSIPLARLSKSTDKYGDEPTGRRNEMGVVNALRF